MASMSHYEQWLAALRSCPEDQAAKVLRIALLQGTRPGGLTLTRANLYNHYEHVHCYYGCPGIQPCDHNTQGRLLHWERALHKSPEEVMAILTHPDSCALSGCITAKCVESQWTLLAVFFRIYEGEVRQRWARKTPGERGSILRAVLPTIPAKHRADVECLLLEACPHQRSGENNTQYALPQINLEDLTETDSMLVLLDTRAHHRPWKLACMDYEMAPMLRFRHEILEPTRYSMGVGNGTYGIMHEWEDELEAANAMSTGLSVHPTIGYRIMALQRDMYTFLKHFIHEILSDKKDELEALVENLMEPDEQNPNTGRWRNPEDLEDLIIMKPLPPPHDKDDFTSLNDIVRDACYRVPTLADLGRLESLIGACKDAAQDHIWLLREDPGYFYETLLEREQHRPELVRGRTCGQKHSGAMGQNLSQRVLKSILTDGYVDLFMWNEMHRHMTELAALAQNHPWITGHKRCGTLEELPDDVFHSLAEAWFFLEAFQLEIIHEIKLAWSASPKVRDYYARECNHGNGELVLDIKLNEKSSKRPDKHLKRILKLFEYLWQPPIRDSLKTHTLVESLERLLQTDARAHNLTSSLIASLLSKLSIVSECARQINLFQPWATEVSHYMKKHQTELLLDYVTSLAEWNPVHKMDFASSDMVDFINSGTKFRYPVSKRRTLTIVETLRSAEAALDTFWNSTDAFFHAKIGTTPHQMVSDLITERTLQRTPPWSKPDSTNSPSKRIDYEYIPLPDYLHDPTKQITGTFNKLSISTAEKTKTHGTAISTAIQDKVATSQLPLTTSEPKPFHLDKRSHKVFRLLFHSPLSHQHPGDIPWHDFLHAMVTVGFAAQKLQGSAWQFTPRNMDVEQPIQFHEPHPVHKLPFAWARRFGRRLTRVYGWRGEMFVLA